jgi:Xaa-Pro aminopeptidase
MKEKFNGVDLTPVEEIFPDLRVVKTPDEVEKIREACKLADACFDHVKRMIQVGVSEYDIGLDIEFYFRRNGADIAFDPIVASGERSARPHGRASEKKLERGDFLTLDFGCKVDGYCSDITRTVVVGEASDRHREVYATVLASQIAALEAMKPGIKAADVDRISREAMGDYAQYFGHGLGHGLGKLVHDSGRLNSTSETVLAPGQVWTVEPGIYIPGFGGVRIEDDVVVTEGGIDVLTQSAKDLLILG